MKIKYENKINNFKRAAELVANKVHLTELGLEELRLIKSKMNRGREN